MLEVEELSVKRMRSALLGLLALKNISLSLAGKDPIGLSDLM
jgi:hypothetical protein